MMKKTLLFSGAVIALLSAGCRPELAEGVYGAEEQQWYQIIKDSYPGYRPPRIASPATVDKASPEALEQQRSAENSSVVEVQAPADDAATSAKVDAAADKTKKEDKKADVKDVKAEDKKADAKDEEADYVIYKVQAGDTPGSIARKFYGKASMYEVIMKANPQIKDAKLIQIGTELKVPKL